MPQFDVLVRGAQILDGTGAPPRTGDVGIVGDTIKAVGTLPQASATQTLEAPGLAVSPGFIDLHSHSDFTILVNPAAESKVRQGVTLEVNGQCGFTPFPVRAGRQDELDALCPFITEKPAWTWLRTSEYLSRVATARPSISVGQLVGHSALRAWVMGFDNRPATPKEIAGIAAVGAEALDEGALGISVGLAYPLGSFAADDEVEALAEVAARKGKLFTVHLRSEGSKLVESVEAMIGIARRVSSLAPLRLQIDHFKASGKRWWGNLPPAMEVVEAAHQEGIDVGFDVYPYTAGSRHLSGSLPAWVHDGGNEAVMARLQDPDCRQRLRDELEEWKAGSDDPGIFQMDFDGLVITEVATPENQWTVGKSLTQIAQEKDADPLDVSFDLLVAENGHVSIVQFSQSEEVMRTCLKHPLGCVGTDSLVFAPYGPLSRGKPHPRAYGTFPRVIGRYARDEGLMTISEAVRKCTSLPASRLGLTDRGLIREGMKADLVVFDPQSLLDTATYQDPHRYPLGIRYVLVNGVVTIDGSANRHPGVGTVLGA
ncbi:MAG: D-aminoacylase [Armatimonadia bacterium]